MTAQLTKSQKDIQKAARRFATREFDPDTCLEMDQNCQFPNYLFRKAGELGFTSITLDEEYDGGGLGLFECILMAEELCRSDSTCGTALMLSAFGADLLDRSGTTRQKDKMLSSITTGNVLCGSVFPKAETDPFNIRNGLKMEVVDSGYRLNGQLNNVINAGNASLFLIPGSIVHQNNKIKTQLLIVEKDTTGLEFEVNSNPLGLRMTSIGNLGFRDVLLPVDMVITASDKSSQRSADFSFHCQMLISGIAVGIAQGSMEMASSYTKTRRQFNKYLAEFQITRHKLAEMAMKTAQSRALIYQAALAYDNKTHKKEFAQMAFISAIETALYCSHQAIQLLGGYGFCSEYHVERNCRDSKMLSLLFGPMNDIKDNIAQTVIGKIK